MTKFHEEQKKLLANPPVTIKSGTYVICKSVGLAYLTIGKKYKVINHFCYLNTYGLPGDRYQYWVQFFTIKNDFNYTVKVNADRFEKCDPPLTDINYLAKRFVQLEKTVMENK